ncbi:MAG: 1-deoxy-D-xylulose-5-phosphate synthase N-terminal domain-containing protein, partial [Nitrospinaceae bacterium]
MTQFIDKVKCPDDHKKIRKEDLPVLAGEIRDRLLTTISKTGGHLGSNMGVVELTMALHYVFDCPRDKFV